MASRSYSEFKIIFSKLDNIKVNARHLSYIDICEQKEQEKWLY